MLKLEQDRKENERALRIVQLALSEATACQTVGFLIAKPEIECVKEKYRIEKFGK